MTGNRSLVIQKTKVCMLVPQTKEVNEILLFKLHQHGRHDVTMETINSVAHSYILFIGPKCGQTNRNWLLRDFKWAFSIVGNAKLNGKCGQTNWNWQSRDFKWAIFYCCNAKLNGKCGQTNWNWHSRDFKWAFSIVVMQN